MDPRKLTATERKDLAAARVIQAACMAAGASLSTCLVVPGLFITQLEFDRRKHG